MKDPFLFSSSSFLFCLTHHRLPNTFLNHGASALILVSYDADKIPTNTSPLHVTSPTQLAFLDFTTGLVVMLHSYI